MSNSTWEIDLVNSLNLLSHQLNRYLSIPILVFGTIGNILNCLALSQHTLRLNPCSFIFLASSIASLITLISGVAVRLLAGWSLDLTNTIGWLCKFRIFILFTFRTIASWSIMLATFDRWLSSSTNMYYRQLCSIKNAQRSLILIILISSLAYLQIFYCYDANLIDMPVQCYGKTVWCRLFIDIEFASISILIPSILMYVFGFMTIINIRHVVFRQIQPELMINSPSIEHRVRRWRKIDHQLFAMLIVQVVLMTLFSLPQTIQSLYLNVKRFQLKTPVENALNSFLLNLFFLLTYITNGMPFYIYTLTGGEVFRQALVHSVKDLFEKIKCRI